MELLLLGTENKILFKIVKNIKVHITIMFLKANQLSLGANKAKRSKSVPDLGAVSSCICIPEIEECFFCIFTTWANTQFLHWYSKIVPAVEITQS